MPDTERYQGRYLWGGSVVHLLPAGISLNDFPYAQALCGVAPRWGAWWLGSGNQSESDIAREMSTCKACARRAA